MPSKMLKVDLHVHTIASGHAYNTILEYVQRARELKMKMIGISDHGPSLSGSGTNELYFKIMKRIPRKIHGITVLRGVEANIINEDGDIDLSDSACEKLDYVMAAFHFDAPQYKDLGKKKNTETLLRTIRSGKVDILTHPFLTNKFDVDIKKVAEEACKYDVLLELNISCFEFRLPGQKMIDDLNVMIEVVRKHGKRIIVNSDAHSIWQLADDEPLKKIKGLVKIEKELIINNYPKELLKFLEIENE